MSSIDDSHKNVCRRLNSRVVFLSNSLLKIIISACKECVIGGTI
jgi:hypothetical protein